VYPDFLSHEKIRATYGAEMYPTSNPRDFVLPPATDGGPTMITALRPNGRAGFEVRKPQAECYAGQAVIRFNDDAGRRWELDSDLSLREVETTIPSEEISARDETPGQPTVTR
jgi:hypothetical protein